MKVGKKNLHFQKCEELKVNKDMNVSSVVRVWIFVHCRS